MMSTAVSIAQRRSPTSLRPHATDATESQSAGLGRQSPLLPRLPNPIATRVIGSHIGIPTAHAASAVESHSPHRRRKVALPDHIRSRLVEVSMVSLDPASTAYLLRPLPGWPYTLKAFQTTLGVLNVLALAHGFTPLPVGPMVSAEHAAPRPAPFRPSSLHELLLPCAPHWYSILSFDPLVISPFASGHGSHVL